MKGNKMSKEILELEQKFGAEMGEQNSKRRSAGKQFPIPNLNAGFLSKPPKHNNNTKLHKFHDFRVRLPQWTAHK